MPAHLSARHASVAYEPTLAINAWTVPVTGVAIFLIAVFANGNFNEAIIPDSDTSSLQQYVVLAMWLAIIGASYFRRAVTWIDFSAGLLLGLSLYALAIVSIFWSQNTIASAPKALAMGVVIFGAYRLMTTSTLSSVVTNVVRGLFFLNIASIVLALLLPHIGVDTDYIHAGQWKGIFASKQEVGICGALLLFFAASRLLVGARAYHWLAIAAAVLCVIGSGSRGGGALAAVAVLSLYLSSRSAVLARVLAFAPLALSLVGTALIVYFVATGNQSISAFDAEIDLTGRTFIWQHALGYLKDAPVFGHGLNGFWTLNEVKDLFLERNGWFLDNYHNGYIGIVMEIGVVGLLLFVASYAGYGLRIVDEIRRAGVLEHDLALTLAFTFMIFFIDFTETFFLRSTNLSSTILVMSLFQCFAHPVRPEQGAEACAGEDPPFRARTRRSEPAGRMARPPSRHQRPARNSKAID